jgi:hypothetical protein
MISKPEHFATEHAGHEFVELSRAQIWQACVFFQYCQTCDDLRYQGPEGFAPLDEHDKAFLEAIAKTSIVARQQLEKMPQGEGPTTDEIVKRIWAKVKKRI